MISHRLLGLRRYSSLILSPFLPPPSRRIELSNSAAGARKISKKIVFFHNQKLQTRISFARSFNTGKATPPLRTICEKSYFIVMRFFTVERTCSLFIVRVMEISFLASWFSWRNVLFALWIYSTKSNLILRFRSLRCRGWTALPPPSSNTKREKSILLWNFKFYYNSRRLLCRSAMIIL